jgi:hypothetical protein
MKIAEKVISLICMIFFLIVLITNPENQIRHLVVFGVLALYNLVASQEK